MIEWDRLTRMPLKESLCERDVFFRESLADGRDILGGQIAEAVHESALLMVKPDGLVTGKLPIILEFLASHGLRIVTLEEVVFGRFEWRELWRYQLNAATLDRLAINDFALQGPLLLLLLRRNGRGGRDLPATVQLTAMKGPSDVSSQPADCLRRRMRQPNRIFSFFHVADEPADLLRELGVLLPREARRQAWAALGADHPLSDEKQAVLARHIQASSHVRSLDAPAAVRRATESLERLACTNAGARSASALRLSAVLARMAQGERIDWRAFVKDVSHSGLELDNWDMAILGAYHITYDEPGHAKQIGGLDMAAWQRRV